MATYRIQVNAIDTTVEASSVEDAVLAYANDAGYATVAEAASVCGLTAEQWRADLTVTLSAKYVPDCHFDLVVPEGEANTPAELRALVDQFIANAPDALEPYRHPILDLMETAGTHHAECYNVPHVGNDGFVSDTDGVRILLLPESNRAALNSFQAGDWQWTDAADVDDALRRYREDDMRS